MTTGSRQQKLNPAEHETEKQRYSERRSIHRQKYSGKEKPPRVAI